MSRDIADLGRPPRSLGSAVSLPEDVLLPFIEPVGAVLDEEVVVRVLGEPHIGDGLRQRRVGAGPRGDPLVAHAARRAVAVGVDDHELDAQLLHPDTPDKVLLPAVHVGGAIGVDRPEDDLLGMLEGILEKLGLLAVAKTPPVSPRVRRAPVPPFPAIGVVEALAVAEDVEEAPQGPQLIVKETPVVMGRGHGGDGRRTVLLSYPGHLSGDDIERFVPGDSLIIVFSAQLRMPFPVGVEMLPSHGVLDPVLVYALPLRHHVGLQGRLSRWGELLPLGLYDPRRSVYFIVEQDGAHPFDDAVLDVDPHGSAHCALNKDLFRHVATPAHSKMCLLSRQHPLPRQPRALVIGLGKRFRILSPQFIEVDGLDVHQEPA